MAQTYRVSGTLRHGVVLEAATEDKPARTRIDVYHDGDEFSTDDPKLEKELRASKTILLPEEYAAEAASEGNKAPQEQLAAERAAKDARIAELEAKLAAFEAGQQQQSQQQGQQTDAEPPKSDEGGETSDQGE